MRFRRGTDLTASLDLHLRHQARVQRLFRHVADLQLVALPPGQTVERALALYRQNPDVLYVEPNYIHRLDATPNDPLFADLWGLHNNGQTGGAAGADINAVEGWDITTGSNEVVIGVTDSGIDYTHEDLAANVLANPGEVPQNGIDDDNNGFVDDIHGINSILGIGDPLDDHSHGTHVSGTIAATGDNGIGVVGVSWNTKLVHCKAFDGQTGQATTADILICMDYFLDLKTRAEHPVNIVATNNSWGGGEVSQALYDAIAAHRDAGMLFVAAAGNSAVDNDRFPHYPSSYDLDNIIAVAATEHSDSLAGFSNYGRLSVDVSAPGHAILSTVINDQYALFNGTSMAAPHVTGLVALLAAQDPTRDWRAYKNLVMVGGAAQANLAPNTLSGRRIRAWGPDNSGSLNCQNQLLSRRLTPSVAETSLAMGSSLDLALLSLNCAAADPTPQTVSIAPSGEVIDLIDATGSGIFAGQWTPADTGIHTLTFSNGEQTEVRVIRNYAPAQPAPFAYRDIAGTQLPLGDDDSETVLSPFPILLGDDEFGMDTIYVGSNGVLSLSQHITMFENGHLPNDMAEVIIAPLWDDLAPNVDSIIQWDVLGQAPARELVIEWRDVPRFPDVGAASFQVVFFEGSSAMLFNYQDVTFGDDRYDGGAEATIGIQITGHVAREYSVDIASVSDSSALLWTTQTGLLAVAGPDQVVLPGAAVTLDGSASEGEIAGYAWTQVAGPPVALAGANTVTPAFIAPADSTALSFALEVVDTAGNTSSDAIEVIVNQPPVAAAGDDFTLAVLAEGTLDATDSFDPDSEVLDYQWFQLTGTPVTLVGADTATATFTAPASADTLSFEVHVTDEYGFVAADTVVVTILATENQAPVADPRPRKIVDPGATVTLDGSNSYDPDGEVVSYHWEVVFCYTANAPCDLTLAGEDQDIATLSMPTAPRSFVYLTLTVTDNDGASATKPLVVAGIE